MKKSLIISQNKHFLISFVMFFVLVFVTLNIDTYLGFSTKYPFSWENLLLGLLCFPIVMPIGFGTVFALCCLYPVAYGFCLYGERVKEEKNIFNFIKFGVRILAFFFLVAICDYCYWDISGAQVSPNMNYGYLYQQYDHAGVTFNDFGSLGLSLIIINILLYLYLFFSDLVTAVNLKKAAIAVRNFIKLTIVEPKKA